LADQAQDVFLLLRRHSFEILRRNGGEYVPNPIKIKGRSIRVWLFPRDKANIQTEDFTPQHFDIAETEEM
jgi:translation initiation factor IF-1